MPWRNSLTVSALSYSAYENNFFYSGVLLLLYGIGNGLPLVLVGTAAGGAMEKFESSRYRAWVDGGMAGLLILLGFYLLWTV